MSKSTKKAGSSEKSKSGDAGIATKKVAELTIRPSSVSLQNCAKAYLALETLKSQGIEAGAYIQIRGRDVLAIATPHSGEQGDTDVLQLSLETQLIADVLPGDRVRLVKAAKPGIASRLVVAAPGDMTTEKLKGLLVSVGLVHTGQWIGSDIRIIRGAASVEMSERLAKMKLQDSDSSESVPVPFLVGSNTEVTVVPSTDTRSKLFELIGALDKELDILRSQTELPLRHPDLFMRFNTQPERGILLYGPPGTGKTLLLKAIARESNDVHVLRINGPSIYSKYQGETESKLRDIFDEADRFAPSIIFIDEIDALAPRRDSDDSGETESRVVATLLTLMDGMKLGGRVVIIGATNRPNKLDPALRRSGRLGHEIEIGIPDATGRRQILDLMLKGMPTSLSADDVASIAEKTHGYVGADLQALVREAVMHVVRKGLAVKRDATDMFVERSDLEAALLAVTPSAMREISLELPKVHWADIGGQELTIQRLRETVEWPLQRADAFERLGITPPRGVLLYGPPGCSKTLLAKALATESGLNFLAVKGPELFNKYVGESERAIREVFRKARQAAPSIIFFDEIDALSVARGEGEAGGDRVLTSLLNEMDGIETLNGVVVLAATNRPDVIDSALMRPGRLDRLVYVSPPDLKARRQILLIQFAKMAIDDSVDLDELATATEGLSGAEIVSMCQEAGLLAMNEDPNVEAISQAHFEAALSGIRKSITPDMIGFFERFAGEGTQV